MVMEALEHVDALDQLYALPQVHLVDWVVALVKVKQFLVLVLCLPVSQNTVDSHFNFK